MKICDESSRSWRYELSHIEPEPLHDGVDVRCVKWQEGPLTVLYPLYDEPTPVRRDIKGNSAHGTRGVWPGAIRLPAVDARKVKLVPTPNLPGLPLPPHGRETHGTLGAPVLPTPVLTVGQNLFAISAGQGLGSTPAAHTPYQGNFYLPAARSPASRPSHLELEGPDGISVLFPHIVLDVLSKDDQGVVVLLHATRRTLDRGLKPGRDALVVEDVLALEPLVVPLRHLKTDGTRLGEMSTAFSVFDRLLFAFRSVEGH